MAGHNKEGCKTKENESHKQGVKVYQVKNGHCLNENSFTFLKNSKNEPALGKLSPRIKHVAAPGFGALQPA